MASGESSEKNPIAKSLPNFGQEAYASIPTEELVVLAIQFLHADGVPATTEEVVSACFKLFPHSFSLKNYFYWPDSAQVARHLNRAKEKGYIKETPADGFKVKVVGRPIAKQVAKRLGIPMPMPPKVEKPKPAEAEPAKPQGKEPPVSAEEKSIAVVAKKKPAKRKKAVAKEKVLKLVKKTLRKTVKPVKKIVTPKKVVAKKAKPKKVAAQPSPAPAKRKAAAKPQPKPKAKAKKAIPTPAPKKIKPIQKRKKQQKQKKKKAQTARQLQFLMPVKPKPVKKAAAAKPAKPKIAKAEKTRAAERAPAPVAPSVSKEEKIKAGKAVHTLERSDAYRQYQKFGGKARISEFDFRNMLFATMESSAETLKRNVDLFRRYAGIHNRADLITFLDFAEGSFAPLLKTQVKYPVKKRS